MSKQLEFALEKESIDKSNNDRDFRELKKQQAQLADFMEISKFKEQLERFRIKNQGWPKPELI